MARARVIAQQRLLGGRVTASFVGRHYSETRGLLLSSSVVTKTTRPCCHRLLASCALATEEEERGRRRRRRHVSWCNNVVFGDHATAETRLQVAPVSVEVTNGTITDCRPGESLAVARQRSKDDDTTWFVDLSSSSSSSSSSCGYCLSPGLIDVHAHISQLGGRNWEGYTTATQAAAAGRLTTIIGMPLNSIPATTTVAAVEQELQAAQQKQSSSLSSSSLLYVHVGLWGRVVPENCNQDSLTQLLQHPNVLGLKAFLSPLPASAGYEAVSPEQLVQAAKICGTFDKLILVHSELMTEKDMERALQEAYARADDQSLTSSYAAHVASRHCQWEQEAVRAVIAATRYCDMHIVHLSDGLGCLPLIEQARRQRSVSCAGQEGYHLLTVETCPHYLLFDSNDFDNDTRFKCVPPIRDASQRERLWQGLAEGMIDMIASDHSPCVPSLRQMPMKQAWAGLSDLQYQLPATWTAACERGFTVLDMATWWSMRPAKLARIDHECGSIAVGKRADLVWWDTEHVGAPNGYSKEYHRWKGDGCYADRPLRGRVLGTWVGGKQVYDGLEDRHGQPAGLYLQTKTATRTRIGNRT